MHASFFVFLRFGAVSTFSKYRKFREEPVPPRKIDASKEHTAITRLQYYALASRTRQGQHKCRCNEAQRYSPSELAPPADPNVVVVDVALTELGHRHGHERVLLSSQSVRQRGRSLHDDTQRANGRVKVATSGRGADGPECAREDCVEQIIAPETAKDGERRRVA